MQWTQDALKAFRHKLSTLVPSERDARTLLEDSNIDSAYIDLSGSPVGRWYEALTEARKHSGALDRLLNVVRERYPRDDFLQKLEEGTLRLVDEPTITDWRGGPAQLEKILGAQSTLVPVSFLEQGLQCARAVVRICLPTGFGTGFLIREDLVMTNNHVISTPDEARVAFGNFNYQQTLGGGLAKPTTLRLDPDLAFGTSKALDWTVVGVQGQPGATFGIIPLKDANVEKDEYVQIIQHPDGGEKQLSYRMNVVVDVTKHHIQYLTDTMPGSSGSPVFNRKWEVVALHHASSTYQQAGHLNRHFACNQGIHINAVLNELRRQPFWP